MRPNTGRDKAHTRQPVSHGRQHRRLIRFCPFAKPPNHSRGLCVKRGKGLKIAFRVTCRQTGCCDHPFTATPQSLCGLADRRKLQIVRVLLIPHQAPGIAYHAETQTILCARRYLACPDHALCPALEPEQECRIVVKCPARHESCQISQQGMRYKTGYEGGKVEGMGADICDAPARPRLRWVSAPRRLFLTPTLDRFSQSVL